MNKKIVVFIEIIFVVVAMLYYVIKIMIPEYKENYGASDKFIQEKSYKNMVEVRIDDGCDFGLVFDNNGKIYHLFFFDNSAGFLYNQDIEYQKLEVSLKKVITILIENGLLHNESNVLITRCNDFYYSDFIKSWNELLLGLSVKTNTSEKVKSLEDRALELGISSNSSLLLEIDFYSKEIVKDAPKSVSKLDKESSLKFSNSVYMKLEDMIFKKNIKNIDKDKVDVSITLIPGDDYAKYYPTTNSWYYVLDGKVYAFIEFSDDNNTYAYCYKGSIDSRVDGECRA